MNDTYSESTAQSVAQSTVKVTTLYNVIDELNEISWQLHALVFGESSMGKPIEKQEKLRAEDKLLEARNQLQIIAERLKEIRNKLEIIGG